MEAAKVILNPARLRILQYMSVREKVRTSEIVENLNDIPRATVYHHVKILEENNMIEVVEENRIRGTTEKVYALRKDQFLVKGEKPVELSTAFHMGLMQEMNEYFSKRDCQYKKDRVFFSTALLYMTDDEYDKMLQGITELMRPYAERTPDAEHKLRKLSLISSPPVNGMEKTGQKEIKKAKHKKEV